MGSGGAATECICDVVSTLRKHENHKSIGVAHRVLQHSQRSHHSSERSLCAMVPLFPSHFTARIGGSVERSQRHRECSARDGRATRAHGGADCGNGSGVAADGGLVCFVDDEMCVCGKMLNDRDVRVRMWSDCGCQY